MNATPVEECMERSAMESYVMIPIPCIENAAENGIKGAVYDQMGLQYIVYWPNIPYQS
jgi:hypothetical protein